MVTENRIIQTLYSAHILLGIRAGNRCGPSALANYPTMPSAPLE